MSQILLEIDDREARTGGTKPTKSSTRANQDTVREGKTSSKVRGEKRTSSVPPEPPKKKKAKTEEDADGPPVKKAPRKNSRKKFLAVGVDFGCTFSGVSFAASGSSDVTTIVDWPNGERLGKFPTRIAYQSENPSLDGDVCGYEVVAGLKSHQYYKLGMDVSPSDPQFDDPRLASEQIESTQQGTSKSAFQKTEDTLRYIHDFTMETLEAQFSKPVLDQTPIKFFLTTPAMWTVKARSETRRAAERAGFGQRKIDKNTYDELIIIDEPEAAAIATMKLTVDALGGRNPLKEDQLLLIADIGGGTSDLVSYKIIKIIPSKLNELCVGNGAKIGGISIDKALLELMIKWFGLAFESLDDAKTASGSDFMLEFERAKRSFDSKSTKKIWRLPLKMPFLSPADRTMAKIYDFEDHKVKLSYSDMQSLFEPVVLNGFGLVEKQMKQIKSKKNRLADHIVLAGGLGSSRYMHDRFRTLAAQKWGSKVQILQLADGWSAISRGATLHGLQGHTILSRRCRASYGFVGTEKFDATRHAPSQRVLNALGEARAKDQITWVFRKDEEIVSGASKCHTCRYVVPPGVKSFVATENLYQSDLDTPPTRLNPKVQQVGKICIDLTTHLNNQREAARKEGIDVDEEPIELVIHLFFAVSGDKGILDVNARYGCTPNKTDGKQGGGRSAGKTQMEWSPNSVWGNEGKKQIPGGRPPLTQPGRGDQSDSPPPAYSEVAEDLTQTVESDGEDVDEHVDGSDPDESDHGRSVHDDESDDDLLRGI